MRFGRGRCERPILPLLVSQQDETCAAENHQNAQRPWDCDNAPCLDLYVLALYHQVLPLRGHHHVGAYQSADPQHYEHDTAQDKECWF